MIMLFSSGYSHWHPEDVFGPSRPFSRALPAGCGDGVCSESTELRPGRPSTVLQSCQPASPVSVCDSLPAGVCLSPG